MSRRSSVEMLPDNVLKALERKIYSSRFSEYQKHSEWLKGLNYDISKSAVHRYGQKLFQQSQNMQNVLKLSVLEQMLLQDFRSLQDDDKIIQAIKTMSMLASGRKVSIHYDE